MYIWNIRKLKLHLINNGLTEIQLFYYILIYVALSSLGYELLVFFPSSEEADLVTYVASTINVLIPVIGTVAAFRANGGRTGSKFPERYFSIAFVAMNRFFVLLIPVMGLLIIYLNNTHGLEPDALQTSFGYNFMIAFSVWDAAMYLYIAKQIGAVAKHLGT
jgi:hypothetical protein